MPATERYPGESDEAFKARMMQQFPQAFGMPAQPAGLDQMAQPAGAMRGPPPSVLRAGNDAGGLSPASQAFQQSLPPPQAMPPPNIQMPQNPQALLAGQSDEDFLLDDLTSINQDAQAIPGLEDQLLQARALRETALPEMRSGGRVQTAANPLEFLATGIKQYRGGKAEKAAQEELKKTRGEIGRKEGDITKQIVKEKGWGSLFRRKDDEKDK